MPQVTWGDMLRIVQGLDKGNPDHRAFVRLVRHTKKMECFVTVVADGHRAKPFLDMGDGHLWADVPTYREGRESELVTVRVPLSELPVKVFGWWSEFRDGNLPAFVKRLLGADK